MPADGPAPASLAALVAAVLAAPAVFFCMKQYLESVLSLERVEAARVDGSGEFRTFNTIVLPILPVLIVYICLSKFIIKGVTSGSVKG